MRPRAVFALLPLLMLACAADADTERPEPLDERGDAMTVSQAVGSSCSTTVVAGLSKQIIQVANCLKPGILVKVPSKANFKPGSATFAYMEKPAVDALVKALDAKPGTTMTVNSMLRTIASQYLLYSWYQQGKCGIALAAKVGSSNHESGLAIDVSNYSTWRTTLEAHSFKWFGSSDTVHFDYVGSGAVSLKSTEVKAFQMLWNYNNPGDKIDEDGAYGPQTEARLKKSPADGFSKVPACEDTDDDDDGIVDTKDNCPTNANKDQKDTDGDKKGDVCDTDDDGDGVNDDKDNCDLQKNADQKDTDGDGQGDACDADDDGDGVNDAKDNCPGAKNSDQLDADGDGQGDACDTDDDGDGIDDDKDNCPKVSNADQKDTDGDGKGDVCENDTDGDGVANDKDNCPTVSNPDQKDTDGDGKGDACGGDIDGDGVGDVSDNCPGDKNADQKDTDGDGQGDACDGDRDGDIVANDKDNCPDAKNADQADLDVDGQGDACDDDRDGDGIANDKDNCPGVLNAEQDDSDKDGQGDACEDPGGEHDPEGGAGGEGGSGGQGGSAQAGSAQAGSAGSAGEGAGGKSTKTVTLQGDAPADDGGCGCRAAGASQGGAGAWLVALGALGLGRLRRGGPRLRRGR